MPNLTGQSIGRYHILEQLGEGGMATVYKAYDTRLERNVAFKVLRIDLFGSAIIEQILKRFEREAKSLAKLSHPNIVKILDYGEHEGSPYLVMEYLPGGTLKQKLGKPIPWKEAIQTLLPVVRGLAYAHHENIIHRDIKPANILMDNLNAPILTDFGIAKLLEGVEGHTLTASGVGIGTPEYMAPEQGIGASTIDARADIYSLGVVLYEMVTGRKPYIADTPMAVVLKQMTDPLPRPTDFVPDLPEGVEHILFKALAKQPEGRYEDMNAFIAAMEGVLSEVQKIETPVPTKRLKKRIAPRPKPSPKVIIAVIGVLAIILTFVFGIPWVSRLLSAMPAADAAVTKISEVSSATITMVPLTSTLEPSSTPTLTRTPRPTSTNTPVPAWVADFAEPILFAIKDREPYFQDDFSSNEAKGWFNPSIEEGNFQISIEEGVMRLKEGGSVKNIYIREKLNYVLQADVSRPASCCVHLQIQGGNSIYLDRNGWGICRKSSCSGESQQFSSAQKIQMTVILKDSRVGFYLMGVPVGYWENFDLELIDNKYYFGPTFECGNIFCEFDNVKFWSLDNVPIP
ncbi:MAG TPA: serine/threonine-protein kinase [Anaerolineales bacterium]